MQLVLKPTANDEEEVHIFLAQNRINAGHSVHFNQQPIVRHVCKNHRKQSTHCTNQNNLQKHHNLSFMTNIIFYSFKYYFSTGCTTRPIMGRTSPFLPFSLMAARMCACVPVCVLVSVHMCVWLHICVLCHHCSLSQNIKFHGHAIPGAVGIACGASTDENADANQCYLSEICI